ncbi:MAG: dimethyl sulfoxide reductase anchor subunit [Pirellulaceae bacterium]|nr:dimethyl sulfoxide reductase anchor subunit [Pirellulaceae bacterium]
MLDSLLETGPFAQPTSTAVDEFSRRHEIGELSEGTKLYRDLIPISLPNESQQYAFEVDLDACSGCKACVTACHSFNGLEDTETWRSVGQLAGGSQSLPIIQHVTTACHHCLEPACLAGCPAKAYEKDPVTGIVRHLDDQCIGCQYCTLTCPYEVPVYSPAKGIVRKCDMCHQRLTAGEAPACVQACPNQAIRIRIVDLDQVREDCEVHNFLPGAPDPTLTYPTTSYKTSRSLPKNLLPADYYRVHTQHGHLPLVWMLVLTQMSVGAFVVERLLNGHMLTPVSGSPIVASGVTRLIHLGAAFALGVLGLAAGTLHLGRPLYAFRAILGLRTSWLSREILGFGLFATTSAIYVAASVLVSFQLDSSFGFSMPSWLPSAFGNLAMSLGLVAVMTSVMIYVATRRPMWTLGSTTAKFLSTAILLGLPLSLLISLVATYLDAHQTIASLMRSSGQVLCRAVIAMTAIKLMSELLFVLHLRDPQMTARKRSAQLLVGVLSLLVLRRFFFGIVGGIALPALLLGESLIASERYHPLFVVAAAALSVTLLFIGELHERYLFFTANVTPRMPGAPT